MNHTVTAEGHMRMPPPPPMTRMALELHNLRQIKRIFLVRGLNFASGSKNFASFSYLGMRFGANLDAKLLMSK